MSSKGKPIQCQAAILWKEGQPMTVETITVDPPQEGEARIKMVLTGLCATDAHFIWDWKTDLAPDFEGHPVVLGHEGAGVIESVGPGVTDVQEGDKVMLMWMPECDRCALCANPKTNSCLSGNFYTSLYHKNRTTRMSVRGKPLLCFAGTATFSEYTVVKQEHFVKVNPKADLKTAGIIGCAVGTGYNSAANVSKVHKGSTCAVWGLGAIGLSCVLGCVGSGAANVIGIDTNPEKETIARKLGCNKFLNPNSCDIEHELKALGSIDYGFDCVGSQAAINSALKSLTPWGTVCVVGLGPQGNRVSVAVGNLLGGQTATGGYFGKAKPREANRKLVDLYVAGNLNIDPIISHRIPLKDIQKGFDDLKSGKTIRTVVEF